MWLKSKGLLSVWRWISNTVSEKSSLAFAKGCEVRNWKVWKWKGGGGSLPLHSSLWCRTCACLILCDYIFLKCTAACDKHNFTEEVASDKRFVQRGKSAYEAQRSQTNATVKKQNGAEKGELNTYRENEQRLQTPYIAHIFQWDYT